MSIEANEFSMINHADFFSIVHEAPYPIVVHKNGVICYLNQSAAGVLGLNIDEAIGTLLLSYVAPEYRKLLAEPITDADRQTKPYYQKGIKVVGRNGIATQLDTKGTNISFNGEKCRLIIAVNNEVITAQSIAEELQDKNLLIEKIAELIPDSLIVVNNITRKVLFENKSLLSVLGYTEDDLGGKDQFEFIVGIIHKEDVNKLVDARKFLNNPNNNGKYISTEYRLKDKSGEWHWILSRSTMFKKTADGVEQLNFGIAQDITPLKKIEQELMEKNLLIEKVTKTLPNHISIFSLSPYEVIYDNYYFGELLGFNRENAPTSIGDFFVEEDRKTALEKFTALAELGEGNVFTTIDRYRAIDGSVKYLLTRVSPFLFDESGKLIQVLSSSVDITDLKEKELQLQFSEEKRKAIINALPDMVFQINRKGEITDYYHNEIHKDLFQQTPKGRRVREIVESEVVKDLIEIFEKATASEEIITYDYERNTEHGLKRFEFRVCRLNDDEVIVVVRNVTELKKAQEMINQKMEELSESNLQLERYITSNTELEKFAYIVSHDLREPVRSIVGFAQLLGKRNNVDLDSDSKDFLQNIVESAERMNKLIHGLLDYSRVSAGAKSYESTDLGLVIEKVVNDLSVFIEETQAEIVVGELPVLKCDELQMRQLFQNLINNALKFQEAGVKPRIEINAVKENGMHVITVRDNGIGIDMRYKDKVFQIFSRLHSQDIYQGSGIGLAVCKKIKERHNGEIYLQSRPGHGSVFIIELPSE